jgi:hypothetical protein
VGLDRDPDQRNGGRDRRRNTLNQFGAALQYYVSYNYCGAKRA